MKRVLTIFIAMVLMISVSGINAMAENNITDPENDITGDDITLEESSPAEDEMLSANDDLHVEDINAETEEEPKEGSLPGDDEEEILPENVTGEGQLPEGDEGSALLSEMNADIEEGYYFIASKASNEQVLDIPGASIAEGVSLQIYKNNGTNAQIFKVIPETDETGEKCYRICNFGSDNYLSASGNTSGSGVSLKKDNKGKDTLWYIKENTDGSFKICSALDQKITLDIYGGTIRSSTKVWLYRDNGSDAQKWIFTKTDDPSKGIPEDGMYKIMSGLGDYSEFALNVQNESDSDLNNINIYSSDDSNYEKWQLTSLGFGNLFKIINVGSGRSLDAYGGGTANGTNVVQYRSNNTPAQLWEIVPFEDGSFSIKGRGSSKMLDVRGAEKKNDANVWLYTGNNTPAQKWRFESTSKSEGFSRDTEIDGIFYISSETDSSYCLDVYGGNTANGANIQLFKKNGTNAQKFQISKTSGGYYTIKNLKSGKVLDVYGGGTVNGTNVWQYQGNGSDAQLWEIHDNGRGAFEIVGKGSGKALDLKGAIAANGQNIQIYGRNNTKAQGWILEETAYMPDSLTTTESSITSLIDASMSIIPKTDTSLQMRSDNNTVGQSTAAELGKISGSSASRFILINKGSDGFEIIHAASGKALDVRGGLTQNDTPVQIYTRNSSQAQTWKLIPTGDGDNSFYIQSALSSGKVITAKNGDVSDGSALVISDNTDSDHQKFYINNSRPDLSNIVRIADKYAYYDTSGALVKDDLKAAHNYSQLILVSVNNVNYAKVSMYTRTTDNSFKLNFHTASGRVGTNGIGKTVQGDKKTPKGIYTLHTPFGIKSDPGCPLGYTKVNKFHYWGGSSPTRSYYNQLADASKISNYTPGGEHLIDYGAVYNYCVAIGYNLSNTPGKGAAIFLHCSGGSSTAGCVSIPEANMITALKNLRSDARIIIDNGTNVADY